MNISYNNVMNWMDNVVDKAVEHRKRLLIALSGAGLLCLGIVGYTYYNDWMQASAHKDFVEAMRYYDAPVTGKNIQVPGDAIEFMTDREKWERVEEVFKNAYTKNRSTGIGGIFKAYQANALARLDRIDDAIETLSGALSSIPSREVKDFYALELALLKIDSSKQPEQQEGLAELKRMAEDTDCFANEAALYYIGYYFWSQKDYAQVRNYWQQFMIKYGMKDVKQQSGFSDVVREKLKLISAEW